MTQGRVNAGVQRESMERVDVARLTLVVWVRFGGPSCTGQRCTDLRGSFSTESDTAGTGWDRCYGYAHESPCGVCCWSGSDRPDHHRMRE
jgi:hypothetical protein